VDSYLYLFPLLGERKDWEKIRKITVGDSFLSTLPDIPIGIVRDSKYHLKITIRCRMGEKEIKKQVLRKFEINGDEGRWIE